MPAQRSVCIKVSTLGDTVSDQPPQLAVSAVFPHCANAIAVSGICSIILACSPIPNATPSLPSLDFLFLSFSISLSHFQPFLSSCASLHLPYFSRQP